MNELSFRYDIPRDRCKNATSGAVNARRSKHLVPLNTLREGGGIVLIPMGLLKTCDVARINKPDSLGSALRVAGMLPWRRDANESCSAPSRPAKGAPTRKKRVLLWSSFFEKKHH